MKTIINLAVVGIASVLVACGSSGGNDPSGDSIVASISLNPTAPSLRIGESVFMSAVARNRSGVPLSGTSFAWSSRNDSVATVDTAGLVRAIAPGSTEVIVENGTVRQAATVTVIAPSEGGAIGIVEIDPPQAFVIEGDSIEFTAIAKTSEGQTVEGRVIDWSVLDETVAAVEPNGRVTALRPGTTNVSATIEGVTGNASIRVESAHSYALMFSSNAAHGGTTIATLNVNEPAGALITIPLELNASVSEPAPSPDGSRFAFVAKTINETTIYIANRDGSNVERLTSMPGVFDQPAWSPDGSRIAFRGRTPGSDSDIWIIDTDGSNARNLTVELGATHQSSPAWSPLLFGREHRIAYSHSVNGLGQLHTMRVDGSGKRVLTQSGLYHDDQPAWSPDGTNLVFQRSGDALFGDLFLVELMTGETRPLTAYSGPISGIQMNPAWSPDGRMIAFASRHDSESYQIYTIWTDGTRLVRRSSGFDDLLDLKWVLQ